MCSPLTGVIESAPNWRGEYLKQETAVSAPALSAAAYSPVKIADLNRVICIRLKLRYALAVESRFTLHSASGTRLKDGSVQIDRVAGFCHLRNALQNYWAEQIATMRDPETSEEINDLGSWLISQPRSPDEDDGAGLRRRDRPSRPPREEVVQKRQRGQLAKTLEKAISHAEAYGFSDIASRLQGIRATLPLEQRD